MNGRLRLLLPLFLLLPVSLLAAPPAVKVTILQTTDIHGRLLPWDYARAAEENVGLARLGALIEKIRKETPNVLLLDAGDTIQGTPVTYLAAKRGSLGKNPMAEIMSALKFDAMAVGNHEFNYGLDVLRKAQKESSFPWLSANTLRTSDGRAAFPEYIVKSVGGVRVGVLGLTTPNIPGWEPEENRVGLKWEDPVITAKRLIPVLRGKEKCEAVVVLIHSGPEIDMTSLAPDGTADENRVAAMAKEVPGIDLMLTGHTHRKIPLTRLHGVPILQPGRWADTLGRVELTFEGKPGKRKLVSVTGELIPNTAALGLDQEVVKLSEPYHKEAATFMDTVIAEAKENFTPAGARTGDTAILDLVNNVEREVTGADLAMAAPLFGGRFDGLKKGPVRVRDVFGLYPYENQLVLVEINGAILKSTLERAAEYYHSASWKDGKLVIEPHPRMPPYAFETIQGVSYRIDPMAPAGSRVKDLTYKGKPVTASDTFTLATNSYRAQGAGGYKALAEGKVIKRYSGEIRDMLIEHLKSKGVIEPQVDGNWSVAPDVVMAPSQPR
jgi:2',3'-cyclic-nucleotide 2'-phosphodiesterase/3'-nucleotidase